MVKNKQFVILPAIYIIISFILIYVLDLETTAQITKEDNFFEYLGFLGFLATSILFLLISIHLFRTKDATPFLQKLSYFGLALLFFLGAGEEISWGQRILGIETPPELAEINAQGETTLHNLDIFQGENELPLGFSEIFGLFSLTLTLLIPLSAYFVAPLKQFYEKFMPIFPWIFGFLFAFNWGIAKLGGMIARSDIEVSYIVNNMVEVKETNYAVLYAVIAIYMYFTIVKSPVSETSMSES